MQLEQLAKEQHGVAAGPGLVVVVPGPVVVPVGLVVLVAVAGVVVVLKLPLFHYWQL